ncbi:hypothetical protein GmHk_10G029410 [Glycine max]|nr:hypothetical protein GmHk_10G029410 [Glycine max]
MDDAQWFSHHMAYHVPCVGNPVLPHRIMTTPTTFFSNSNNDYLTDFEWLVNRIIGLALPFLLSCFISGLNPELHKVSSPGPRHSYSNVLLFASAIIAPSSPRIPFKQLSSKELVLHRDHGLYYHYEEKWVQGHHCKPPLQLFIADEDNDVPDENPTLVLNHTSLSSPDLPTPQLSLNALACMPAPKTIHVYGTINHHCVLILVDGGSTHNFIRSRIAKFLGLPTTSTHLLHVMVGNGTMMDCTSSCPQVSVEIHDHRFVVDLYALPLSSTNLVLGV